MSRGTELEGTADPARIREFFETLFEKNDRLSLSSAEPRRGQGWRSSAFSVNEDDLPRALDWIESEAKRGREVYFVSSPIIGESGSGKQGRSMDRDVARSRILMVDLDGHATREPAELEALALDAFDDANVPPPTAIVWTGGGLHAHWRLKGEIDPKHRAGLIKTLAEKLQELGADASISNPSRLMRCPGTINAKPGRPRPECKILSLNGEFTYELADFPSWLTSENRSRKARHGDDSQIDIRSSQVAKRPNLNKRTLEFLTFPPDPESKKRNSELFAAAMEFNGNGISIEEALSRLVSVATSEACGLSHSEANKTVRSAYGRQAEPSHSACPNRPEIPVVPSEYHLAVDRSEKLLASFEVFQSGNQLVRVVGDLTPPRESVTVLTEDGGVLTGLTPHTDTSLNLALNRAAKFVEHKISSKGETRAVPIDCPLKVSAALRSEGNWKNARDLAGIVLTPTLRRDGSILSTPGYDPDSKLFYIPSSDFPAIHETPSKEDAQDALKLLDSILVDFPFVESHHKSAMLAAILTGVLRRTLDTAPIFVFEAPAAGTGKSLLASVVTLIQQGRTGALCSPCDSSQEDRKRLFALLLHGAASVTLDNFERLESTHLCAILTAPTYEDRILGRSESVSVRTNALFLATGNNVRVTGDLTRRAVPIALDAKQENPDQRSSFQIKHLRNFVLSNRGELVAAALTIARAYVISGDKVSVSEYGSFESWSARVREPLIWLGLDDPLKGREAIDTDDSDRDALQGLLVACWNRYGIQEFTSAKVVREANENPSGGLALALESIREGRCSVHVLGCYLRSKKNRYVDGLRFVSDSTIHRARHWRIEYTKDAPDQVRGEKQKDAFCSTM